MPVARVKIAPIERWCKLGRMAPAELGGLLVEIDTGSMEIDVDGRQWKVVGGPALAIMQAFAPGYESYWFCEHMLEMD